jgi:3'-5' exoribonuclease
MYSQVELQEPIMHPVDDQDYPHNQSMLPKTYRLTSIQYDMVDGKRTLCIATLYHDKACMRVCWTVSKPDFRMKSGSLVSPRWLATAFCEHGAIKISRLVLMECPEPWENLFHTVPHDWVKDRQMIAQAAELIDVLPRACRFMFNAIFWDGQRFKRFCIVPSVMNGTHGDKNGTLIRAVELALLLQHMAKENEIANEGIGILAGFLNDAGKADEYRRLPTGEWKLSDRGRLLGHRITVIEWISQAKALCRLLMPEEHYLALLHSLSASASAPEWFCGKRSVVLDAVLLSNTGLLVTQDD